jgi:pimeloyl-ACP methyl ester carboxylesterase
MADAPLVLLGGSGLGPWAWQRVTPLLEESGLRVIVPTLSATADDATPAADVDLGTWVADVVRALDAARVRAATIVAHSFAGYLAGALAERHPSRVHGQIFVDANIPSPGVPWLTAMGPEIEGMLRSSAHEGAVPFFSPEQFDAVHPDSGLSADDRDLLLRSAMPQPLLTEEQPAVTVAPRPDSPYIRCTRTRPPAADIDGWTRVVDLDTGHWPMLSAPGELAEAIVEGAG